jgi:hypothetical protein
MHRYGQSYRRDDSSIVGQVVFGILIAAFILGTIGAIIRYIEIEQAKAVLQEITKSFNRDVQKITRTSPMPIINMPKSREQVIRENSEKAIKIARQETADFKAQYVKPEKCYDMKDRETRIFCANHFMRAKKEFELRN